MHRSKEIQEELLATAPELALHLPVNPYSVPADYFNKLPDILLARIRQSGMESAVDELNRLSPLLGTISKKMPYSVPEQYFQQMAAFASEAGTKNGSGADTFLPSKQQDSSTVEAAFAPAAKRAKVISLRPNKIFRYAAAAVAVGIVVLLTWFLTGRQTIPGAEMANRADTPAEKMLEERMTNVSEEDMNSFMESSNGAYFLENATLPASELAGTDALLMFEGVSDKELEQYLKLYQPAKEKFN